MFLLFDNDKRELFAHACFLSEESVTVSNKTFVDIRRYLHQIPELGFQEFKTQAYLLKYLHSLKK